MTSVGFVYDDEEVGNPNMGVAFGVFVAYFFGLNTIAFFLDQTKVLDKYSKQLGEHDMSELCHDIHRLKLTCFICM